jgi:glutaredoxin
MIVLRFLLLTVLIAPAVASADVYKWTDAQGRVHYSDSAPPDVKTQPVTAKINSISGPAVVSTFKNTTAGGSRQTVRILTAAWCGHCKKAKAFLAAKGVAYEEVDVEASDRGRNEFTQLGGRGVPIILVGAQRMYGFEAGALTTMLEQAGW